MVCFYWFVSCFCIVCILICLLSSIFLCEPTWMSLYSLILLLCHSVNQSISQSWLESCAGTMFAPIPTPFLWYCPGPNPIPTVFKISSPSASLSPWKLSHPHPVPMVTVPVPTPFPMHLQIITISAVRQFQISITNTHRQIQYETQHQLPLSLYSPAAGKINCSARHEAVQLSSLDPL